MAIITKTKKDLTPVIVSGCCFILIIILCIVGSMDYQDELRDQRVYCENVKNHAWPDYNHNAKEICK